MDKERIQKIIEEMGKPEWSVIFDLFDDEIFKNNFLNNQQRNFLENIKQNPNFIRNNENLTVEIISKYIGWNAYNKGNLKNLKKDTDSLNERLRKNQKDIESIEKISGLISGATVLVSYAKEFKKTSGLHKKQAEIEFKNYKISLAISLVIVGLIFFFSINEFKIINSLIAEDLKLPFNTAIFILKAIMLIMLYQIVHFFRKTYNAEKHLEEVYTHRSNVLNSLHAVYLAIDNKEERDKIISAGALYAYDRGETGYLSTKEGAGSGESLLDSLIKNKL